MSFGWGRLPTKNALMITLLLHEGVSLFLPCSNSRYLGWVNILSGWFRVFSELKICGTVRTGLACTGCWKFPWLLYHLLCFLDRNYKLRETFWWDYLNAANIYINQTDFPPWVLGYKQVEMFWDAKQFLMQQIGFLYFLFSSGIEIFKLIIWLMSLTILIQNSNPFPHHFSD